MIRIAKYLRLTFLLTPALAGLVLFSAADSASAQNTDGADGGNQGQGGGVVTDTDTGDNNATGGGTQSDGELDTVEPLGLSFEVIDRRNQGFVGATAESIGTNGFVGPITSEPDGELAEGRSIGGGVNEGLGNRGATTSSSLLQENGFTVERKGIRTRLRPAFAAPRTPGYVAQSRFQSRMTRQPVVHQFGQGVTVTVSNRTAVLTGVFASAAERDIVKRQLRLEPGVYQIDDRTSTAR
ncbi:hypothetical protein [Mariniblastus fucicola]|uniref:BON domain protein n=1 Tax=Mariniblastus fucicola TaxID=980251 RepID=A0A5B9PC57_9BACT|nr:hypothetical protein [Mariniblastus fucicola]QEG22755.1 hypothetical protein MFFC18_26380 [Mariniblastus fucicola]